MNEETTVILSFDYEEEYKNFLNFLDNNGFRRNLCMTESKPLYKFRDEMEGYRTFVMQKDKFKTEENYLKMKSMKEQIEELQNRMYQLQKELEK